MSRVGAREGLGPAGLWAVLGALPVALPAALAGYSVVAMVALLAGQLRPLLVLPVGLAAAAGCAAVAWRAGDAHGVLPDAVAGRRERRLSDLAALVVVAVFLVLDVHYASQYILVYRDPGFYALTGQWLAHHPSLPIDTHAATFGHVPGLVYGSQGFGPASSPGHLDAQAAHLLPALLGSAGWVAGDSAVLKANAVIGALGLWAFYGFGRLVARPVTALAAAVALSLTLPELAFTRSTYTEPLAQLFVFGGLALLWGAHSRASRWPVFALAGLVLGGIACTRIDGFFNLLPVLVYAAAVLAAAAPQTRRVAVGRVAAVLGGAAVTTLLGYVDLALLSPVYLRNLRDEVRPIGAGGVVLVLAGAALVLLAWRSTLLTRALTRSRRWLAPAGGGLVALVFLVLASRPLWLTARATMLPQFASGIAFLQRAHHETVDGSRTYAEVSLSWVGWYTGWLAVGLGLAGTVLVVVRMLRRFDVRLVVWLVMHLSTALLYLDSPHIAPDQIWGARRLFAVVTPSVLLGAAVLVSALVARRSRVPARPAWLRLPAALTAAPVRLGVGGLLVAGIVLGPLPSSRHLYRARDGVPLLAAFRTVCTAMGPQAAVVVDASLQQLYPQTFRSYCNVPVAGLARFTPSTLSALRAATSSAHRRLYAISGVAGSLPVSAAADARRYFSKTPDPHWGATLDTPPKSVSVEPIVLYVGAVRPDGRVSVLAPRS